MAVTESVRQPRQKPDKSQRIAAPARQPLPKYTPEPGAPEQDRCKHQVCDETDNTDTTGGRLADGTPSWVGTRSPNYHCRCWHASIMHSGLAQSPTHRP